MRFRGTWAAAAIGLASLLGGTGCIKSTLLKGQIQSTRLAATAADTLQDYEVARHAGLAGLVQFEGMHKLAPDNEDALFLLLKGWTSAAFAFMEDDMEVAEDMKDPEMAEYHKQRAVAAYERAINYGSELLDKHAEGFAGARKNTGTLRDWLKQNTTADDTETLMWLGYAWVARASVSRSEEMIADLWVGVTLVERSVELNERYANGNGLTILAAYHARTAQAELDESQKLFERAFAITGGKALLPKFNYASRYLCARADSAGYKKVLQEIIDAGDIFPEQRLQNAIAKRKARRYLGKARLAEMREDCGFRE